MTRYAPLLDIVVEHGFFATGRCPGLRFSPTADTAAWLRCHGCVSRETDAGLLVYAECPLPVADSGAPAEMLTWCVSCDDPQFAAVSDGLAASAASVLMLCADSPPDAASTGPRRLHHDATVSRSDAWPLRPPGSLAGLIPVHARPLAPAFVVRVPAVSAGAPTDTGAQYRIAFAARAPVWKYCLLGPWSSEPMQVVDASDSCTFGDPVAEELDDGRSMLTIRSSSGIALQERTRHRFQLRARTPRGVRVLVDRLPVAGVANIARETVTGAPTLVCEIYVHR